MQYNIDVLARRDRFECTETPCPKTKEERINEEMEWSNVTDYTFCSKSEVVGKTLKYFEIDSCNDSVVMVFTDKTIYYAEINFDGYFNVIPSLASLVRQDRETKELRRTDLGEALEVKLEPYYPFYER